MKIAAVLAFTSLAYAVGRGGKGPDVGALIKKAACALPCVDKAASKVICKGKNLVESLCSSVDEILKSSEACVHKCGIDKGHADLVAKGAHLICSKRGHGKLARRQDAIECADCQEDCKQQGCASTLLWSYAGITLTQPKLQEDQDACDYCVFVCDMVCEG